MHSSQPLREQVSRYMSYLLRHNPENLHMDEYGFVELSRLTEKLNERFRVGRELIEEIVERSDTRRFELVDNKIRALYGHTRPARIALKEDTTTKAFYHGTTPDAAERILDSGLKPMKREWVHLSP
ncbi:MAG: RNA 2'-phosphotransferase, partial [Candidatus Bathyarchaeota archaeon]|nr:RNA 2'-phosphotransferase [Candidatus Bathyarchaeota archaeon]